MSFFYKRARDSRFFLFKKNNAETKAFFVWKYPIYVTDVLKYASATEVNEKVTKFVDTKKVVFQNPDFIL